MSHLPTKYPVKIQPCPGLKPKVCERQVQGMAQGRPRPRVWPRGDPDSRVWPRGDPDSRVWPRGDLDSRVWPRGDLDSRVWPRGAPTPEYGPGAPPTQSTAQGRPRPRAGCCSNCTASPNWEQIVGSDCGGGGKVSLCVLGTKGERSPLGPRTYAKQGDKFGWCGVEKVH